MLCTTAAASRRGDAKPRRRRTRSACPPKPHAGEAKRRARPALRPDIAGAVHYPLDCHLAPDRLMASLEAAVASAGGTFLWNTDIVGWRCGAGRSRRRGEDARRHEIEADEFVLCAGAWSAQAARELGLDAADAGRQGLQPHAAGVRRGRPRAARSSPRRASR